MHDPGDACVPVRKHSIVNFGIIATRENGGPIGGSCVGSVGTPVGLVGIVGTRVGSVGKPVGIVGVMLP